MVQARFSYGTFGRRRRCRTIHDRFEHGSRSSTRGRATGGKPPPTPALSHAPRSRSDREHFVSRYCSKRRATLRRPICDSIRSRLRFWSLGIGSRFASRLQHDAVDEVKLLVHSIAQRERIGIRKPHTSIETVEREGERIPPLAQTLEVLEVDRPHPPRTPTPPGLRMLHGKAVRRRRVERV